MMMMITTYIICMRVYVHVCIMYVCTVYSTSNTKCNNNVKFIYINKDHKITKMQKKDNTKFKAIYTGWRKKRGNKILQIF